MGRKLHLDLLFSRVRECRRALKETFVAGIYVVCFCTYISVKEMRVLTLQLL